jgi:hypothetical protein
LRYFSIRLPRLSVIEIAQGLLIGNSPTNRFNLHFAAGNNTQAGQEADARPAEAFSPIPNAAVAELCGAGIVAVSGGV